MSSSRALLGALGLALVLQWVAAFGLLESPLAVVLPLPMIVWGLGALLALAALAMSARDRRARALGLALALLPAAWVAWQQWGRIECSEVEVSSGDTKLAGTLCVPRKSTAVPAAILVHGSGPGPRAEPLFYARFFARRGVAALAFDKRGSGQSGGETYGVGYIGYARDAAAFVPRLRNDPRIRSDGVGFVGWSEAEWVIPIAAEESSAAFAVVISGSGLTPERQVRESLGLRLARAGHPEAVTESQALHDAFHEYLRRDRSADEFARVLDPAVAEPWFSAVSDALPRRVWPRSDYAWWIEVMDFDATTHWRDYDGPALFIHGGRDDRSESSRVEARVRAAFPPGRDPTFVMHPEADHALLEWPLGEGAPPPRWPTGYPEEIPRWISTTLDRE